jgi:hypothetical protein
MKGRREIPSHLRELPAELRGAPYIKQGGVALFVQSETAARRLYLIAGPRMRLLEQGWIPFEGNKVYFCLADQVSEASTYRNEEASKETAVNYTKAERKHVDRMRCVPSGISFHRVARHHPRNR